MYLLTRIIRIRIICCSSQDVLGDRRFLRLAFYLLAAMSIINIIIAQTRDDGIRTIIGTLHCRGSHDIPFDFISFDATTRRDATRRDATRLEMIIFKKKSICILTFEHAH